MHRFFVSIPLKKEIILPVGELYHQLTHVFRARAGGRVILFSEGTDDVVYEIGSITKKSLVLSQKETIESQFSAPIRSLTVLQAYPNKLSTLEFLVQKFTELGVEKVVFWKSDHAQMQDISPAKQTRIVSIAREALEQCGANSPLIIEYSAEGLQKLLEIHSRYTHIVGHYEGQELPKIPKEIPLALWVGPEGGWSVNEKQFFEENKIALWKLNHRILRLETAAIVGAGILLT